MNKKEIEKAIEELKSYIEIWELEQADFDLEVILYKETIESMKVAIQALEKQVPVAFDVDKVVKQLKECERYIYDAVSDEDNYVIDTEKAIEIVKGAVKDEPMSQNGL